MGLAAGVEVEVAAAVAAMQRGVAGGLATARGLWADAQVWTRMMSDIIDAVQTDWACISHGQGWGTFVQCWNAWLSSLMLDLSC